MVGVANGRWASSSSIDAALVQYRRSFEDPERGSPARTEAAFSFYFSKGEDERRSPRPASFGAVGARLPF